MQYNAAGFHAAVLSYSVEPHHFLEPQKDLMSAIRILRENGDKWGIHEEQIAIIGFSAGGHLCASVSTLWHLAKEDAALYKPNAAILCYAMLCYTYYPAEPLSRLSLKNCSVCDLKFLQLRNCNGYGMKKGRRQEYGYQSCGNLLEKE